MKDMFLYNGVFDLDIYTIDLYRYFEDMIAKIHYITLLISFTTTGDIN